MIEEKDIDNRRKEFEEKYGKVWDTNEATKEFEFLSFASGFAFVRRRKDGIEGSLDFTSSPRFYHSFIQK